MSIPAKSLDRMVRKLASRAPLSDADRDALMALPNSVCIIESASYMIREGDLPQHCPVLLSGFAFRQKLTGGGGRQILSLHMAGDMLDLQNLFLDVSDHNVQTLTRVEAAFISRAALQELILARPAVAHAILVDTLVDSAIFREWIVNVGRRDSRTRIAHLLCEFALRLEVAGLAKECRYELPMTQEQLADAVGLTPVHVNRTLKMLEAEGLIVRNKRQVTLPDRERMRLVGDFNERYLHLDQRAG